MHLTRTAATLLGAIALAAPASLIASARDAVPAQIAPAQASPGQSVTVTVVCDHSSTRTVTANSEAFARSATLSAASDGRSFTGTAQLAPRERFPAGGARKADRRARWGVDGRCPDGDPFVGRIAVVEPGRSPQSGMHTGLSGSVSTSGGELATGAALVVAGIGGFWLLRRRVAGQARI